MGRALWGNNGHGVAEPEENPRAASALPAETLQHADGVEDEVGLDNKNLVESGLADKIAVSLHLDRCTTYAVCCGAHGIWSIFHCCLVFKQFALRILHHEVIDKRQGHHSFHHGHRTREDARIVSAVQDVRSVSALRMSEAPTRCPAPLRRWLYPWRENRLVTASTCWVAVQCMFALAAIGK